MESSSGRRERNRTNVDAPPTMGSMQIASGSNGFGHNIDFISESYLLNASSEIDIEGEISSRRQDCPFPIFLKFADVEFKVHVGNAASSANLVKAVMSKVATQLNMEQDSYKQILKGVTGRLRSSSPACLVGDTRMPAQF